MRRLVMLLTMAVSFSVVVRVGATDDLVLSRFSDYLDSLRSQAGIPALAATLVGASDVTWDHAFGQWDVDRAQAARTDTLFHLDGLTQLVTATLVLRCVEDGRLLLDNPVGDFSPNSPEAGATLRQLLTHTSSGPDGPVFAYRPDRLDALVGAVSACTGGSFRAAVAALLDRFAMIDSVPGPDAVGLTPPADGLDAPTLARYARALDRLAVPYAVDSRGRATASRYPATTLRPASGLISTVRDLARFDLALKSGALLRPQSLATAWTPPVDRNGQRLPHGVGWFEQSYNGERVVWQFGVSDNASSSMIITVPGRGLTLILLANSQGLVRPFPLASGDVTASPFARLFLGIYVR